MGVLQAASGPAAGRVLDLKFMEPSCAGEICAADADFLLFDQLRWLVLCA
jgi:hypothetical protein